MKKLYIIGLLFLIYLNFTQAQNVSIQSDSIIFQDDFETTQNWGIFEEIVGGDTCHHTSTLNCCYDNGLGEVDSSSEYAHYGTHSLLVWANKNLSIESNHVIGHDSISGDGILGRYTYSTYFFIPNDPDTAQTGPEFSVQSTRIVLPDSLTFTVGIQYVQNPWVHAKWNIYHDAQWDSIDTGIFNYILLRNTWYYLEIKFDYDLNKYISMTLRGQSIDTTLDLTQPFSFAPLGCQISGEIKGFAPSTQITLEGENLWTGCTRPTQSRIFYDDVMLVKVDTSLATDIFTQNKNFHELEIYPNPSDGKFAIRLKGNTNYPESTIIEIINVLGEVVARYTNTSTQIINVDLPDRPSGIYYARISIGTSFLTYLKYCKLYSD